MRKESGPCQRGLAPRLVPIDGHKGEGANSGDEDADSDAEDPGCEGPSEDGRERGADEARLGCRGLDAWLEKTSGSGLPGPLHQQKKLHIGSPRS